MVNLTAFCSFFTPALANLNQAKILATFSGHEKNAKTNTSFLFGSEKSLLILCDTLDLDTARKMPKIDTLDALEEHEEHEDDYQTNSNW